MVKKRNKKQAYFVIIIFFIGYILNVYLNRYLITHLDLDHYGDFKIFESLLYILIPLTTLGGIFGVNVFGPPYFKQSKQHKVVALFFLFVGVALISTIILMVVSLVIIPAIHNSALRQYISLHHSFEFLFIIPVVGVYTMISRLLNASGHFFVASLSQNIFVPAIFVSILIILDRLGHDHVIGNVFAVYGGVFASLALVLMMVLFRFTGWRGWPAKSDFEIKHWLTASVSLLLTEIILSVVVQIDMLLLEIIGPVEADVGVFGALLTLCTFLWVILSAVQFYYMPLISSFLYEKNWIKLERLVNRIQYKLLLVSVALLIITCLFPGFLISIIDPSLVKHKMVFILIFLSFVVRVPFVVKSTLLTMSDYRKISGVINLIALIMIVVLEILLVPTYRIWGAAIPLLVSRLLMSLSSVYYCKKHLNISYFSIQER